MKRAYDELERFSWSQEELLTYEKVIKRNRDNAALLLAQFQKGEQKGEERGMKQGIAIGEESAKHSMARQMLSRGMDIALISELTGMSEESIRSL